MKTTSYYYTILAVLLATGAFASSSDNDETFEELEKRRQAAITSYDSSSSSSSSSSSGSSSSSSSGSSSSSSSVTDDNTRKRSERIEEANDEEQAQKVARTQQLHQEIMQPLVIINPLTPFFDAIERNDFDSIYTMLQAEKHDAYRLNEFINAQEYKNFLRNLIAERKFSNILQLDQEEFIPNDPSITGELSKHIIKLRAQDGRVTPFAHTMLKNFSQTIAHLLDPTFSSLVGETEQWTPLEMPHLSTFALLNLKSMMGVINNFGRHHSNESNFKTLLEKFIINNARLIDEEHATIENITELINAGNFLDVHTYIWLWIGTAIVKWAHKEPDTRWAELNSFDTEKKRYIYKALKTMINVCPYISPKLFIYNKAGAFGVSIQDLIDYGLVQIITSRGIGMFPDSTLSLSASFINDLTGLDKIPDIQNVTTLLLDNNYISSINNLNIFNNLTNLSYLSFTNNPISSNTSWQAKIRRKIKTVNGNKIINFVWKQ